jgi:hypothetical protein
MARAIRLLDRLEDTFAPSDAIALFKISMEKEEEARYALLAADSKDQASQLVDTIQQMMGREECVSEEDEEPPDYDSFEFDEE